MTARVGSGSGLDYTSRTESPNLSFFKHFKNQARHTQRGERLFMGELMRSFHEIGIAYAKKPRIYEYRV
jgi:hypothetical protein